MEEEFNIFSDICIDDSDSESERERDYRKWGLLGKPIPHPPPQPAKQQKDFVDWRWYIAEKCENKIQILDRQTFDTSNLKRPIVICFNYFRHKCSQQSKYLDTLYQLALKYADRIDFIAADRMDIDLMYPHSNPIAFFCLLVDPERESLHSFAIDTRQRIHQHYDAYQNVETFSVMCDQLLSGDLYPSQSLEEISNEDSLVKICVHLNYDELVTNNGKDVFLIVGLGEYQKCEPHEPDYEQVARMAAMDNVDVVYINADKNFVPFHLQANCYPTLIFIPAKDKENFLHWSGCPRDTPTLIDFIKQNLGEEGALWRQQELMKQRYKPFDLPSEVAMTLPQLEQYLIENYPKSFRILNRLSFHSTKRIAVIYFMDFQSNGVNFYLETLQRIHQVALHVQRYGSDFYIADISDIDILYPHWYKQYLPDHSIRNSNKARVFGRDRQQRLYEVEDFASASELFFFYHQLSYNRLFRTQSWPIMNAKDRVPNFVALHWERLMKKPAKDIFLTVYWPTYKDSHRILRILDDIVEEVHANGKVQMYKMNARDNYVPLEFTYERYPVHFFIPRRDGSRKTVRFSKAEANAEDLLAFIAENVSKEEAME